MAAATGELAASEERYRSLISTMSDGVLLFGPSGEIAAFNPAAEDIMGLSGDQMMGRDPIDRRWRTVHEDGAPMPREERPSRVTAAHRAAPRAGRSWGSTSRMAS